jgi:Mrp family chromosome partitioning ATPase
MSRYFDLVQQAGLGDRAFASDRRFHASAHASIETELDDRGSKTAAFNTEILDLVQRIFLVPVDNTPKAVVFAPVEAKRNSDGLCQSVAETLANVSRRKVCLVEANFRAHGTPRSLGKFRRHGLTDALTGEAPISSFCQQMAPENLWLLPAGALDANSPSLITPERLKGRFAELRAAFEFIIIDAAPMGIYAETIILSRVADGVALVLDSEATRRDDAGAAVANLRALSIPILAAVLNKVTSPRSKKFFR